MHNLYMVFEIDLWTMVYTERFYVKQLLSL
jgi:hypothetical protein